MLVIATLIVAAVGLWQLVQGAAVLGFDFELPVMEGLRDMADSFADLESFVVGATLLMVGILTLFLAFLIFIGSRIGRTLLTIILVIAALSNAFALYVGDAYSLIELVLAIAVLVLLYRPNVSAYFRRPR